MAHMYYYVIVQLGLSGKRMAIVTSTMKAQWQLTKKASKTYTIVPHEENKIQDRTGLGNIKDQ